MELTIGTKIGLGFGAIGTVALAAILFCPSPIVTILSIAALVSITSGLVLVGRAYNAGE